MHEKSRFCGFGWDKIKAEQTYNQAVPLNEKTLRFINYRSLKCSLMLPNAP